MSHEPSAGHGFEGGGRGQVLDPTELVSVDEYRHYTSSRLPDPDPIELRSADALGLVLAEDVLSEESLPSFPNSAMDGYAVVATDTTGATEDAPVTLTVTGEVAAGASELPNVAPGQAVRIMTGAPVPPGADAIVPVEVTRAGAGDVAILHAAEPGDHVRTVGEDVRPGQGLLRAGHRIRPADVGLLAAVGRSRVVCYPQPRVVILTTGDELVPAEHQPGPGQIRDANGPMLAALIRQAGAVPFSAGIVADDRQALHDAFDSNLGHADLFVASGGVSAGLYDLVREVIGSLGEVRGLQGRDEARDAADLRPRSMRSRCSPCPGNPVSTFVSFEVFVRPALRQLQGRRDTARPTVRATLSEAVHDAAAQAHLAAGPPAPSRGPLDRDADRPPGLARALLRGAGRRARRDPRGGHRPRIRRAGARAPARRELKRREHARRAGPDEPRLTHVDETGVGPHGRRGSTRT